MTSVLRARVVCTLAALAPCLGRSTSGAPEGAPNVLLITIDALRADHLGCYGYARPTSPALDAFAASAVVFEDAATSAPTTLAALASLMTGELSSTHGCTHAGAVLSDSFATLAERLLAAGYDTACVVDHPAASSRFGLQQGFVHGDDSHAFPEVDPAESTTSQTVSDRAIRFLDQTNASPDARPWFLWLHYSDPLARYVPHAGVSETFVTSGERTSAVELADRYDGEVRYTDQHVERVLARLAERRLAEHTVVVVVADHGEELFDHGGLGHAHSLHREVVRVPLAIRAPDFAARRVSGLVRTIDVLPTLLELAGIAASSDAPGRSLVAAMRGAELAEVGALAELEGDGLEGSDEGEHAQSWQRGRFELLRGADGATSLFDLASDPRESADVAAQHPAELAALRAELEQALAAARERARLFEPVRTLALTPGAEADLAESGYDDELADADAR